MKVSNETKVGILAAVATAFLVLGFNFLKGKTMLKTGNYLHAKYSNTKGIMISNPVFINGFQVGSVADIENADELLSSIIVSIKMKGNYSIPTNSVAIIKENPLGPPSIEIMLGNKLVYFSSGDTIATADNPNLLAGIMNKLSPVTAQLQVTIHTLDSVLKNINSIFNPSTKSGLQQVILNVNKTTENLVISSASLQKMLNEQTGSIALSMQNVHKFTHNLNNNNDKISQTFNNMSKAVEDFSKADISGSVLQLKSAIIKLNEVVEKVNSSEGTVGKLINDKALYNNLNNTIRSANILVDDLRVHPKRYVNISVFGKKDKINPLNFPLTDSIKAK